MPWSRSILTRRHPAPDIDDDEQAARAKSLFASNRVFLPKTVLLEAKRVSRRLYGFERRKVAEALRGLSALEDSETEHPDAVRMALDWAEAGLDFAGAPHLASSPRAKRFATLTQDSNPAPRTFQEQRSRCPETEHGPDGFNVGGAAGRTVMHLRAHLIPRCAGDQPDPRGGVRRISPELAGCWSRKSP
jgi:hypothetical protein